MRDEDAGEREGSEINDTDDGRYARQYGDLFGEFSVLSPGVHIVLDGRSVSSFSH